MRTPSPKTTNCRVADLSNEDSSVTVIPMQGDEFICSQCFLVKHRSQLAYTDEDGQPVCEECAA